MKNLPNKAFTFWAIFILSIVACKNMRRDPDKSQIQENDTVEHYNIPAHVIKGPDTMQTMENMDADTTTRDSAYRR